MPIECPSCGGECIRRRDDELTAVNYCPDCQSEPPGPPGALEKAAVIFALPFIIAAGLLAKVVYGIWDRVAG